MVKSVCTKQTNYCICSIDILFIYYRNTIETADGPANMKYTIQQFNHCQHRAVEYNRHKKIQKKYSRNV